MSEPPLYRAAGPIALAAGVFFVVTDLGRYPLLDDRLTMATARPGAPRSAWPSPQSVSG